MEVRPLNVPIFNSKIQQKITRIGFERPHWNLGIN